MRFSKWLRAATSTRMATFRPDRDGDAQHRNLDAQEDVAFVPPVRTAHTPPPGRHASSWITNSIRFRSRTAATPNRSRMLMIPSPRISM